MCFRKKPMDKKNILLVDDDATIRDLIKDALKKEYNILEASGYSEAVKLFKYPIDLALIDYVLPDSDGFEVLKAIRDVKPALPAIIMTGYSNENVVIKALRTEVADYIKKPVKLAYLRRRLSEILGGKESNRNSEGVESREEFILDGIAAYVEEKYMKDLTLDKLASMACINRFKFCRDFKKRFSQTFTSYLNTIRVKNAAELLKNPNLNITEIAYFVGYKSVIHFDRVFRAVYGISPREYRKKISNLLSQNKGVLKGPVKHKNYKDRT
jgi:YesN/AraC family two-component response regulator